MTPSKIRLKSVTAKAELIREMLASIETLPLASEDDFTADPRMVAAGESFLRRSLEALLDLGRHVLSKGFGKVVPDYAAVADELAAQGILPPESAAKLRLMADGALPQPDGALLRRRHAARALRHPREGARRRGGDPRRRPALAGGASRGL